MSKITVILGVTILILSSGCGKSSEEATSKATGMEMVLVPAGEFTMGGTRHKRNNPVHKVYIDAFYIDKYEITNAEYEKFDPSRKSERSEYSLDDDNPVIYISWRDTMKYCNWRSRKEGLEPCYNESIGKWDFNKNGYRLPTEAEWEKAARGTDERKYPWGNEELDAGGRRRANYDDFKSGTLPVGDYESDKSPYGVYDMAGNVQELCYDWYDEHYYKASPYKNPRGPAHGTIWVLRGGAFWTSYSYINNRNSYILDQDADRLFGFRCVRRAGR